MPEQYDLSEWQRGDPLDHNRFNEELRAIRDLLHRMGVMTRRGPTSAQDFRGLELADNFLGLTTETPPSGLSALTDAQYYIKRSVPEYRNTVTIAGSIVSNVDRIAVPVVDPVTAFAETLVATNLSELPPNPSLTARGSHGLPDGTPVHVFVSLTRTSPTLKVYWFVSGLVLPKAQYENEFLMSRADHAWGASLPRISESNELP